MWQALYLSLAALLVVDLFEIGVDYLVVVSGPGTRVLAAAGARAALRALRAAVGFLLGLVHPFAELHRDLGQSLGLRRDVVGIVGADGVLQRLDRGQHRRLL